MRFTANATTLAASACGCSPIAWFGFVEHPHQLRVRCEHVRVEPLGDLDEFSATTPAVA